MDGKICMVTGATSGIGAAAATELARLGATVVAVGRNRERCEEAVDRIRGQAGNPSVDYLLADLSSQDQIRRLARAFREQYPRLDVLINNAGAFHMLRRRESVDGIEMTFALNHLAPFLLTSLLLDLLEAGAPSRVVNVSSVAHTMCRGMRFDDLQFHRSYRGLPAYAQSKLANLLFTFELARRLEGTGVTVNALHPGVVATNIFAGNGLPWRLGKPIIDRVYGITYITPEEGARTVTYLAASPEVEGVSGRYFVDEREAESSPASRDEDAARRLWQISEEMTGLTAPARA